MKLLFYLLIAKPIIWLLRSIVLVHLWAWFVVGTFNIDPISGPQAIGLSILVSLVTFQIPSMKVVNEDNRLLYTFMTTNIMSLGAWVSGYIISLFL